MTKDKQHDPQKAAFFISDVHLGSNHKGGPDRRLPLLLDFLGMVEVSGSHLFMLGDLFDFWFEYKTVIPRLYFELLYELRHLTQKGIQVYLLKGNHDFWMDSFFPQSLGIPVYDDFIDITVQERRLYVSHGDGLARRDHGYRFLKNILRHPLNVTLYRLIHPDLGYALASFSSKLSRDYKPIKDDDEDYLEFARGRFPEGYDCVILGHTHRPLIEKVENGVYLNTGDWMSSFTYGKLFQGVLTLEHWPSGMV